MSRHRRHRRRRKSADIVIILAVLGLAILLVVSDIRYKHNLALGGSEDDVVVATTTTTTTAAPLPVEENESILNLSFNYVAYSKINGIAHCINTVEQYEWSAKKEFTSIKGDVRITSDGKLVMCRDEGITLNENGKIVMYDSKNSVPIRGMTEEECLALRHEARNTSICTFEDYVKVCKRYDKLAFITIWDEYIDEIVPQMIEILQKYEMVEKCIVNSYNFASLQAVRKREPSIVLSKLMEHENPITKTVIDEVASMGNCIVSGFSFDKTTKYKDVEKIVDLEMLDYAKEKNVRVYETQVHSMAIANKLKEYGYAGAQMMVVPTFE